MVATSSIPFLAKAQAAQDAIDQMTDPQRVALGLYATNKVTSTHCVLQLTRLQNLARETAFEISATRMADEVRNA
jgi:putative heme degradation protein